MKKIFVIIAISIGITGIFIIPPLTDQLAGAGSTKKIHFTETITSSQDPGQGHESHQIALILSPNLGTLYDGTLTYTSSEPVKIAILHEISKDEVKDQPTWTVDGNTVYGLSLIDQGSNAGSIEFTGSALALHSDSSKFTATVSVDGWIRGQPTEIVLQQLEPEKEEPSLKLSRSNVPATIPLHIGTYDGDPVYYIATDTNDETHAELITEKQNWKVELAPPLSEVPEESLGVIYMFKDGIKGKGIHGFQDDVFSNTPSQTDEYSALRLVTNVSWKLGQNPEILDSVDAILNASDAGRIELETTEVIINVPQIVWPEGQMQVRENKTLTDDTAYTGGQILDINQENMTVTFVAHRGWAPDGRTIYYIVTDATPTGPAEMMGVTDAPTLANMITNPAAVDLYQFLDGIKGSGPLGFQPGIAAAVPGDETYSPIWRILMISWNDPEQASILETKADIDAFHSEDLIEINLARPMNSVHIVNCPFIDPFQSINSTKNG
ncbi:MAG: hypothetical protein ACE5EJ_01410 [Nitrosopumilaceae archaeon]